MFCVASKKYLQEGVENSNQVPLIYISAIHRCIINKYHGLEYFQIPIKLSVLPNIFKQILEILSQVGRNCEWFDNTAVSENRPFCQVILSWTKSQTKK